MSQFASAVYPVPDRFIDLGKESPPGTIAAATYTFPMTTFKPEDKVTFLEDTAWRNAMAELYNVIEGVQIAEVSLGGPFFVDGMGYALANIMGDYYQGVNAGTSSATTQMSVTSAIGAGSIVVTTATGISNNTVISIGGTASTACEVRKVTNVTGTTPGTLTLNAALYQAHSSAAASGTVVAWGGGYNSINHNFSLQNIGLGAGGYTQSQPPTYTYYDYTGVPATSGARQYAFACYSEVTISSDATKLIEWDGKITALASQIANSTPTVALSTVIPQAAWRSTVNISGAGTLNTGMWKLSLMRKLAPKFTNSGQQDPFTIARGYFTAGLSFDFDPASDELEYLQMRNNTQPTVVLTATNGLTGSASASLTVTANQAAMVTSVIEDSKDVFGFNNTAKLVANTTNVGPSGGFSPCLITLANAVINY
ncbi:MAG: hypothetical protein WA766_00800 [Candidatus Acidiferrales bacterium]